MIARTFLAVTPHKAPLLLVLYPLFCSHAVRLYFPTSRRILSLRRLSNEIRGRSSQRP